MSQSYLTLCVTQSDQGVLSVVIDAPPMNLIGPELVRDPVTLLGEVEADEQVRVMVLESANPEYFVPCDMRFAARPNAVLGQGPQTRGLLELDLGDRIGSLQPGKWPGKGLP